MDKNNSNDILFLGKTFRNKGQEIVREIQHRQLGGN